MKTRTLWSVVVLAGMLVAAGCGSAGGGSETADDAAPSVGPLADVCPNPLVIQSDWFPESEHGPLYQLIGEDYAVDAGRQRVRGTLVDGDAPTGIEVEVRTGGPAIGFALISSHLYADTSIHLGYVSTDEAVLLYDDAPTIAVLAPLEKNPQMIMWDPDTYPEVRGIEDLGAAGVVVAHSGSTYVDVLISRGLLSLGQTEQTYDGSPARFIAAGGEIAQQGFASAEPYQYENLHTEWGRPVAFELIHDTGFRTYAQALAMRTAALDGLSDCMELFVPIAQQAIVDYYAAPQQADAIIVEAVETYDDFWRYDADLARFSVEAQLELDLVANGGDDTVGNQEIDRVAELIDQLANAGLVEAGTVEPADIVTNEFIDEAIGF